MLKRLLIFIAIIILLALLSIFLPVLTGRSISSQDTNNKKIPAFVNRVIDGDTIAVSGDEIGKNIHIRFLGINTPEKKHLYYQEAKDYLIENIENRSVYLLQDGVDKDKYGRSLRYVFLGDRLINVEEVQEGLATTLMIDNLKYKTKFETAENYAIENGLGLWIKSQEKCSSCIKLDKLDPINEFFILQNICDFDCNLTGWEVKDDTNHFIEISPLKSKEVKKYSSPTDIWNNDFDRFFLRDKEGNLVIYYTYNNIKSS